MNTEYPESGLVRLARPPAPFRNGTTVGAQLAARHNLPPYVRRPTEDAATKIARLQAELAAAKPEPWWQTW